MKTRFQIQIDVDISATGQSVSTLKIKNGFANADQVLRALEGMTHAIRQQIAGEIVKKPKLKLLS